MCWPINILNLDGWIRVLFLPWSISVKMSQLTSRIIYVLIKLSSYLTSYLSSYLSSYLVFYLVIYPTIYIYLSIYLPTYLPTYLHYRSIHPPSSYLPTYIFFPWQINTYSYRTNHKSLSRHSSGSFMMLTLYFYQSNSAKCGYTWLFNPSIQVDIWKLYGS